MIGFTFPFVLMCMKECTILSGREITFLRTYSCAYAQISTSVEGNEPPVTETVLV